MGNILSRQPTSDDWDNINAMFVKISNRLHIDNSQEINDIQSAVPEMLERLKERLNERSAFKISNIESCGSVAEGTSVWKIDMNSGEPYLEFDNLAVLRNECDLDQVCYRTIQQRMACSGCRQIERVCPGFANSLKRTYGKKYNDRRIVDPDVTNYLFLKQLTSSVVSYCSCLCVKDATEISEFGTTGEISFKRNGRAAFENGPPTIGCGFCTVEKSTGTLSINTSVNIYLGKLSTPAKCSLILAWTSNTGTLVAPHGVTGDKRPLKYLTIYVDFLPAFSVTSGHDDEQGHFAVAKHCNTSRKSCHEGGWRKSKSMTEIDYIKNKMNRRHKNCFALVKYFTETLYYSFHRLASIHYTFGLNINKYHLKVAVLQHSLQCSKTSTENYAKCVIKIFTEISDACVRRYLKSYRSKTNLMKTYVSPHAADFYDLVVARLCTVKDNDTMEIYLKRFLETQENDIGRLNRRRKMDKRFRRAFCGYRSYACIFFVIAIIFIVVYIFISFLTGDFSQEIDRLINLASKTPTV